VLPCLFGFLRDSGFTIPTEGAYNPSRHLSLSDTVINNRKRPRRLQLLLKRSKTDPFNHGVKVYIADTLVCLIKEIFLYLGKRNKQLGPLFITKEGKGWTRAMFHAGLKSLIDDLKLDKHCYNTHSFHIGAETLASLAKIPDSHIQILGRWRSNAFNRYIRPPPTEIANMSKVIAAESQ